MNHRLLHNRKKVSGMELSNKVCFLNRHNTKKNSFRIHSHDCYELVYFLEGNGKTVIGDKSYPVSAHSYCIIPPNTEHIESMNDYGEIIFIGFDYKKKDDLLTGGVYYNQDLNNLDLLNDIFKEYREQNAYFELAAAALLEVLLIKIIRNMQTDISKNKDLNYLKEYIEQHFDQKINFQELAVLSGYSYDYFRHIFKERFGLSPQEYMIQTRIKRAKAMLESTKLSCTEIAYRCGFSNGSQMSAMFRKKLGYPPKNWRE